MSNEDFKTMMIVALCLIILVMALMISDLANQVKVLNDAYSQGFDAGYLQCVDTLTIVKP